MRRRRGREKDNAALQPDTPWVNQPFRALKQIVAPVPVPRAKLPQHRTAETAAAPAVPPAAADPSRLFEQAMRDVKPLAAHQRERVEQAAPATPAREVTSADAEALAELCDLVSGATPFDITASDEHIEGSVIGLDPRLVRRLRCGDFAYQGFLDLHRMTTEEARPAVEAFLARAHKMGKRCVLIVHGRGRNSKDQIPVLKQRLIQWLSHGLWSHWVLAFTSARPVDGGVGALYVLLRRQRQSGKHPIRVTKGAQH